MEQMQSTRLKLNKSTIRTLSPAETDKVAGGYYSEWCTWDQNCYTYQWYSCGDPHSAVMPHTCFICY